MWRGHSCPRVSSTRTVSRRKKNARTTDPVQQKGRGSLRAPLITDYCTASVTESCFCVKASVAVTVTLNVVNAVGFWRVTVAVPFLLESACDVAVTATVAGRPAATVGAV